MIEETKYIQTVRLFYAFLESELGFDQVNEVVNGNAFFDVEYRNSERVISVSYENIEDYLQIIIFMLENGEMPDYNDKSKTLHLSRLASFLISIVSREKINSNSKYFAKFNTKSKLERQLLKQAKELRLCLEHFDLLTTNISDRQEK